MVVVCFVPIFLIKLVQSRGIKKEFRRSRLVIMNLLLEKIKPFECERSEYVQVVDVMGEILGLHS